MQSDATESSDDGEHIPIPRDLFYDGRDLIRDLPQIGLIAAGLGAVFTGAALTLVCSTTNFVKLPLYVICLVVFHFLEFYITAKYNPSRASADSFLLNNGVAYNVAHLVAFVEAIVEYKYGPQPPTCSRVMAGIGFGLVLMGQTVRSLAMVHAASNFSHTIVRKKHDDHQLVTTGVYSLSRHPSYFGFFYWALGLQMFMLNPVSFLGFAIVLWRFFNDRIADEESHLVAFFGDRYINYKRSTPTRIPYIP
ncbi:hypothetical protein TRICI_000367 [Trichomonascus ciferrii]|uniref:Protein-S-isoprenylcysteine O-methyltransferase n=1 Tax=Trichomonascus ciferrii TaxID=44093 RepID=A0A642VDM9_9ASCO|nr:hypothetical protein TRICI_000367 [Trichomonascus ciferrii]